MLAGAGAVIESHAGDVRRGEGLIALMLMIRLCKAREKIVDIEREKIVYHQRKTHLSEHRGEIIVSDWLEQLNGMKKKSISQFCRAKAHTKLTWR